ncbi:MAG: hypothetical protein KC933_01455 [Myxococcales bacterium]|nr:hypothetical protein [Myxococcales bacterium]
MFPLLLAASLAVGLPYQDTRGRFALELPEGWALAPRFGDTDGMRFERRLSARVGGGVAHLTVHARPDLDPRAQARAEAAELRAAGYRVKEGRAKVGGQAALRVTAERGGEVIRDDHVPGFRIRLEVQGRQLRPVSREVKAILRSFRAGAPASRPPDEDVEAPPPPPAPRADLVGRYESDVGTVLELDAQGGFRLGGSAGRYQIRGDSLTLAPTGGKTLTFTFRLSADALVLSAPALKAPMVYRRAAASEGGRGGSPAGRWRAAGPDGPVELLLSPDGRFELAGQQGQWVVDAGMLRMRRSETEVVSYRFTLSDHALRLSDGDLDDEVTFQRVRP